MKTKEEIADSLKSLSAEIRKQQAATFRHAEKLDALIKELETLEKPAAKVG